METKRIGTRLLFARNLLRHRAYEACEYPVIGELKNTDFAMNNVFRIGVYPGVDDGDAPLHGECVHQFISEEKTIKILQADHA